MKIEESVCASKDTWPGATESTEEMEGKLASQSAQKDLTNVNDASSECLEAAFT